MVGVVIDVLLLALLRACSWQDVEEHSAENS
jgi:hypothetical protein